jgi:hypothetical protein
MQPEESQNATSLAIATLSPVSIFVLTPTRFSSPIVSLEELYEKKTTWYDCPGLFEWWCNKYNQPYSKEDVDSSIDILAADIVHHRVDPGFTAASADVMGKQQGRASLTGSLTSAISFPPFAPSQA